jgi:uncharacterized Zn finger protein
VRIISEGKKDTTEILFECFKCGCVSAAYRHELKPLDDFRNGTYYTTKCPQCSESVSSSQIYDPKMHGEGLKE